MKLTNLHHIAIISSDIEVSKKFYTEALGFEIIRAVYRAERQSWKIDLALNGKYLIELFSFPDPPVRPSRPEALGLRHLAFQVENLELCIEHLIKCQIEVEPIRVDEFTQKRFTFFIDPDKLPIELYES